jgi:hypothetical protein
VRPGLVVMVVAVAAGCGPSDRERDCAEVRAILQARDPTDPPRRYWDYSPGHRGSDAIFDASPYERLRQTHFRDPAVQSAVRAFVDETGWTFYTPYSVEAETSGSKARLAKLCGLPQVTVQAGP